MMISLLRGCRRFQTGRLLFSRESRRSGGGIGIFQHSIISDNKAKYDCRRPLSSSYLSKSPYCNYSEVYRKERHWKIGGDNDAYLSLLMDLVRFGVDVELRGNDYSCLLGPGRDSMAHYNRLLLQLKGFVKHGSAGVYDHVSYDGDLYRLSKTGLVNTLDSDETTRFLSRTEMKHLLLLDEQEVQKSITEFCYEIRDEALSSVARGGSSLGDAVMRYDDTNSLHAWEAIEDAWENESSKEELIERFGFTPDEIFARMQLQDDTRILEEWLRE